MEKKDHSLEFTVLRHKITVLAPFYSSPCKQKSSFRPKCVFHDVCIRSCYRASNLLAIHCKHDRFCSQVQVAMYRMQMLLHLRHLWQRCKYIFHNSAVWISQDCARTKSIFPSKESRLQIEKVKRDFYIFTNGKIEKKKKRKRLLPSEESTLRIHFDICQNWKSNLE